MSSVICLNLHATSSPGLLKTPAMQVMLYADMEPASLLLLSQETVGLLRNAGVYSGTTNSRSEDKLGYCAALPSSLLPSH